MQLNIVTRLDVKPTGERSKGSTYPFEAMRLLARASQLVREISAARRALDQINNDCALIEQQMRQELEDMAHQVHTLENLVNMTSRLQGEIQESSSIYSAFSR